MMVRLVANVVLLLSMLMLPLGMGAASAKPMTPHHAGMAMPMEHCPDGHSNKGMNAGFGDCTMGCSAALPAIDASPLSADVSIHSTPVAAPVPSMSGLVPEIATPPPK